MRAIKLLAQHASSLSGDEYAQLTSVCEQAPESLRAAGCIVVPPAVTTSLGRMHRSELGSGPRSFIEVLGLYDLVIDYVVERLKPVCFRCQSHALPPRTLDSYQLPDTGVVALAVVDKESGVSLRERAELLGVERACVDGYLVFASDVTREDGEPILCAVAAKDKKEAEETAQHWFTRGGGELRVLHYASRGVQGSTVGVLDHEWRCAQCAQVLPSVSRAMMQEASSCPTCRGEGWLVDSQKGDISRWIACRDCDALGFIAEFSRYHVHGIRLAHVLALSVAEFQSLIMRESPGHELVSIFNELAAIGLKECALGMVYDLCSPGERTLISIAQLRLAKFSDATCLLDGAYGDLPELPAHGVSGEGLSIARLAVQPRRVSALQFEIPKDASRITVRDVHHGALRIDEVTFPHGAVTAICGPVGTGKSLLLRILSRRFAQRRKLGHLAFFGDVDHCWSIDNLWDCGSTVLSTLDFTTDLAHEIAQTRRAKELGILGPDLELPRSKYRCDRCQGSGRKELDGVCDACQGALYDWRVAGLPLLGGSVGEIVRAPIREIAAKLWLEPSAEAVLSVLVELGGGELSLSTPAVSLSPAWRRAIRVAALLARVGAHRSSGKVGSKVQDLSKQLVLLDGPRVLPAQYEDIIGRLLNVLSQRGATILYASIPQGLESCCQSMIRLEWFAQDVVERAASAYLDVRFSRQSRVVMV